MRVELIKTSYESWKLLFMDLADDLWAKVYGEVLRHIENGNLKGIDHSALAGNGEIVSADEPLPDRCTISCTYC